MLELARVHRKLRALRQRGRPLQRSGAPLPALCVVGVEHLLDAAARAAGISSLVGLWESRCQRQGCLAVQLSCVHLDLWGSIIDLEVTGMKFGMTASV